MITASREVQRVSRHSGAHSVFYFSLSFYFTGFFAQRLFFNSRSAMRWTEKHDIILLREILLREPFKYRHGSSERGAIWEEIADLLNKVPDPNFTVIQKTNA